MIKSFNDLETYQKAKKLYPEVVEFSMQFPKEGFHLRDQLCRSANSIQANIAEGYGRSVSEFKMYLTRSLGSCNETGSHITDAINAKFGNASEGERLFSEYDVLGKQIYRLREKWH
ncbi:MAG: four helix bundle protein [Patescibacteria group bacterium]|nr:four helix bundle protein [Patescibacteria group bacterium]